MRRSQPHVILAIHSVMATCILVSLCEAVGTEPTFQLPSASAEMLPANAVPLQSAELSATVDGPVMEVFVREGQHVQKGDRLAYLDNRVALAAVCVAESAAKGTAPLDLAQIQRNTAHQHLNRIETARAQQAASPAELEEAKGRLAEAEAVIRQAQERAEQALSALELERAKLREFDIVAPFSGTVLKVLARPGENSARSKPMFVVANLETLRADLFVPIPFFGSLEPGMEVRLVASAPVSRELIGRVEYVEPVVDGATSAFRCVVHIPNPDRVLPAGFQVRWIPTTSAPNLISQH